MDVHADGFSVFPSVTVGGLSEVMSTPALGSYSLFVEQTRQRIEHTPWDACVDSIISALQPTSHSEGHRFSVFAWIKDLVRSRFPDVEVFLYGSVPLRTYLPEGDLDVAIICPGVDDSWLMVLRKALVEASEYRGGMEVTNISVVVAEVPIIKCCVAGVHVDISANHASGLYTLHFLETMDRLVGRLHLLKRSIILVKAWCRYEAHVLGSHAGLLSTYALEILILYILNTAPPEQLRTPLQVLLRFLEIFSEFDFNKKGVSITGVFSLDARTLRSSNSTSDGELFLEGEEEAFVLSAELLRTYGFGLHVRDAPGLFIPKQMNISDPLSPTSNIGRSVSFASVVRIGEAFRRGRRLLVGCISACMRLWVDGSGEPSLDMLMRSWLPFFENLLPVCAALRPDERMMWASHDSGGELTSYPVSAVGSLSGSLKMSPMSAPEGLPPAMFARTLGYTVGGGVGMEPAPPGPVPILSSAPGPSSGSSPRSANSSFSLLSAGGSSVSSASSASSRSLGPSESRGGLISYDRASQNSSAASDRGGYAWRSGALSAGSLRLQSPECEAVAPPRSGARSWTPPIAAFRQNQSQLFIPPSPLASARRRYAKDLLIASISASDHHPLLRVDDEVHEQPIMSLSSVHTPRTRSQRSRQSRSVGVPARRSTRRTDDSWTSASYRSFHSQSRSSGSSRYTDDSSYSSLQEHSPPALLDRRFPEGGSVLGIHMTQKGSEIGQKIERPPSPSGSPPGPSSLAQAHTPALSNASMFTPTNPGPAAPVTAGSTHFPATQTFSFGNWISSWFSFSSPQARPDSYDGEDVVVPGASISHPFSSQGLGGSGRRPRLGESVGVVLEEHRDRERDVKRAVHVQDTRHVCARGTMWCELRTDRLDGLGPDVVEEEEDDADLERRLSEDSSVSLTTLGVYVGDGDGAAAPPALQTISRDPSVSGTRLPPGATIELISRHLEVAEVEEKPRQRKKKKRNRPRKDPPSKVFESVMEEERGDLERSGDSHPVHDEPSLEASSHSVSVPARTAPPGDGLFVPVAPDPSFILTGNLEAMEAAVQFVTDALDGISVSTGPLGRSYHSSQHSLESSHGIS